MRWAASVGRLLAAFLVLGLPGCAGELPDASSADANIDAQPTGDADAGGSVADMPAPGDGAATSDGPPAPDSLPAADLNLAPSILELHPLNAGLFWDVKKQPFTATRVFKDGKRQDVTKQVSWSSSNAKVVSVATGGLAIAQADHGKVTVTATLPGIVPALAAKTSITVVRIDPAGWPDAAHKALLGDITSWKERDVLRDVKFTKVTLPGGALDTNLTWKWIPPWKPYPNGVSGRTWFFWSVNGGKTFKTHAWDWLGNTKNLKQLGYPPKHITAWTGTMHSAVWATTTKGVVVIGGKTYKASPKERTNIVFATVPGK